MALNVNRAVVDPFYRYKMPRILAKVEGKGNGIKTVVVNMADVARSLERAPSYITKYFGFELGAQTSIDVKKDRYVVNGAHDANKLQDLLDGFIRKFVLCPQCENPETALKVRKNVINSSCKACGHSFLIDPKLRLSSFIAKNPPVIEGRYGKAVMTTKKENNVDVEAVQHKIDSSSDADDYDWAEPTEEETRLAAGVGKLVMSKDLEKSSKERLDMLHRFFIEAKETGKVDGKALLDEAERLDLKRKAPKLLVLVFLDEKIIEENQLKSMTNVFQRFTDNDSKAQRYLLGGIEQLIVSNEERLLPKAGHIIHCLYEYDIVDEETLLAWEKKVSDKHVSKADVQKIISNCGEVLNWLKNAEEESDEDNDDVVFQRDSKKSETKAKMKAEAARREDEKAVDEDGKEIDVEDI